MRRLLKRLLERGMLSIVYHVLIRSGLLPTLQEIFIQGLVRSGRYQDPKRLIHYENQCYSRHGQDGIISEIFNRIGSKDRTFVEIGSGNGLENNTAYLLLKGWSGTWFDGGDANITDSRKHFSKAIQANSLKVEKALFTKENAAAILSANGVPLEFDLLSLDIDRNTYHVWHALAQYRPRVAVIEYNASILPGDEWVIEYHPDKSWNSTTTFGASLKSLEILGNQMGYDLVGCDLVGVDAFFVRKDLSKDLFSRPYTAENHYEPPRFYLLKRNGHPAGFSD